MELETRQPCSVCTKLFQRYRIYQPERWSTSLPTAMCQNCAAARQCCQVCYCDISTLVANRIYSDTVPPGGSFLQPDVDSDTLQKRYEGTFLRHMKGFVPLFVCTTTLESLQKADEKLLKDVCSHLCVARYLVNQKIPIDATESQVGIHLTISLFPEQRDTFFLDVSSTCARIRTYIDTISGVFVALQHIEMTQRFRLANSFGSSASFGHEPLDSERFATTETQGTKDVQLTNVQLAVIEHNSFSLSLVAKSVFLVELMCLLRAYTQVDAAMKVEVEISEKATPNSQNLQ